MENMDIAFLPALAESYPQLQSIATKNTDSARFVPLDYSMAVHAMYIIEISTLFPEVSKQAWQSLRTIQSQLQQRNTRSSSSGKGLGNDVPRLAPPEPEPEPPAAPPYVPFPLPAFDSRKVFGYVFRPPNNLHQCVTNPRVCSVIILAPCGNLCGKAATPLFQVPDPADAAPVSAPQPSTSLLSYVPYPCLKHSRIVSLLPRVLPF
jgi:hypothetical protein